MMEKLQAVGYILWMQGQEWINQLIHLNHSFPKLHVVPPVHPPTPGDPPTWAGDETLQATKGSAQVAASRAHHVGSAVG